MKTLDLEHLVPEQSSKMVEGSYDCACACVVPVINAQPDDADTRTTPGQK